MSQLAIFIDGGYLYKVLENEFYGVEIDYEMLANYIANTIHPDTEIFRVYYYDCPPYQSNPPTPEEKYLTAKRNRFFDTLDKKDHFKVRLGRLALQECKECGYKKPQQKMVDTLLSIEMVRLSTQGKITHVALVAGDSDFVPAVKVAFDEGVVVWLFHGNKPHNELLRETDRRVQFTSDIIAQLRWK